MIREIMQLFEPWKTLYANSSVVSSIVTSAHIVSLVIGGGLAIAADRTTLRALKGPASARPLLLEELHAVHRPVLIGLGVLFVTGALLMAADFKTFVESPVFWVKMGLLLALLVNGALLYQAEQRLNRATVANIDPPQQLYVRLRRSSHLSIGLWLAITVGGAILTSTGS